MVPLVHFQPLFRFLKKGRKCPKSGAIALTFRPFSASISIFEKGIFENKIYTLRTGFLRLREQGSWRWGQGSCRWGQGSWRWGQGSWRWGQGSCRWGQRKRNIKLTFLVASWVWMLPLNRKQICIFCFHCIIAILIAGPLLFFLF